MGIIHSLRPHQKLRPTLCGRFLFLDCCDGGEPDKEGSERSDGKVKGTQQNHQERRDWHDFVWELYIPFARTKNSTGLVSVFIFDFQMLSDWRVYEF